MLNRVRTYICLALIAAIGSLPLAAQEESKVSITPTGRVLMDAGLFITPQKQDFKDGAGIPEVRLGACLKYEKWMAQLSVGFARNKLALKDLYLQYHFSGQNWLRVGSFIHQFGLQAATSSSLKDTMEEPLCQSAFGTPWMIGVMGVQSSDKFFGALSAHVEQLSIQYTPNEMNHEGYGFLTRLVYRPMHYDGKVVQVGFSGGFATPRSQTGDPTVKAITLAANFPTRIDYVKAIGVDITEALNMWKFSPELLLAYKRFALESQYYFARVNMKHNLHSFTGMGAYVNVRALLRGPDYSYKMSEADLALPSRGNLELVLGYNYTTLSDAKALGTGIFGGRVNTFSSTLSYYINRYMIARLNYTYTHRWDAAGLPTTDLGVVQARLQFIF